MAAVLFELESELLLLVGCSQASIDVLLFEHALGCRLHWPAPRTEKNISAATLKDDIADGRGSDPGPSHAMPFTRLPV